MLMQVDGSEIAMAAIVLAIGGGTVVALAKVWFHRLEQRDRARALPDETNERLLRIEQAVDAIAIEVERMSESQRFTQRILAERLPPSPALPSGHPRGQ